MELNAQKMLSHLAIKRKGTSRRAISPKDQYSNRCSSITGRGWTSERSLKSYNS